MHVLIALIAAFICVSESDAFFFGAAGGGSACGCAQPPACAPAPVAASPCGGAGRARAYGARTMNYDQPIMDNQPLRVLTVPDDLDLRAAAFGVPFVPQEQRTVFDILHNLGESNDGGYGMVVADGSTNTDYFPKENDEDLTISEATGGLNRAKEIRRSPSEPTVHVHQDVENTAESSDKKDVKVDTGDEVIDVNKCNSQVLRKLMLENMNDSSAESKKNVNLASEAMFGGNVDVICSRGHFSYIFTSNLYCEASKGLTTCIAFRQSEKVRRR